MSATIDVLVVGSLNADLVAYARRLPEAGETVHGHGFARVAGGKGLNQAVAAARAGARTAMIGCVGDDDLGTFLLGEAAADTIDTTRVHRVPGPSGVALIEVDDDARNRIIVVAGANAALDAELVGAEPSAVTPRVVLCQLETPLDGVLAAVRAGRAAGAVTVLNPAPAASLPGEVLEQLDWLVPNEHEASLVLGTAADVSTPEAALDVARRLRATGPRGVVVTLGGRGAVAVDPDGTEHVVAALPVTPVDTTAAGDSFCGAFAAALAAGLDAASSLRRAGAAGALATTRRGAVPSVPTAAEVDALLRG